VRMLAVARGGGFGAVELVRLRCLCVIQSAKRDGRPVLTLDGGLKEAARRAGVAVIEV
jgi:hypothetical protein